MSTLATVVDFVGRRVAVGSRVRVRGFTTLHGLSRSERKRAQSMIGETFTVEEIDEGGLAWVTKWWDLGKGRHDAHGVGLAASEMELVDEPPAA